MKIYFKLLVSMYLLINIHIYTYIYINVLKKITFLNSSQSGAIYNLSFFPYCLEIEKDKFL